MGLVHGSGNACGPTSADVALRAKLITERCSRKTRTAALPRWVRCFRRCCRRACASDGGRVPDRRLLGSPRDEVAILCEGRVNQLIQDVVRRLADEAAVGEQRVSIRFLEATDVAQDLDAMRARFDQRHGSLLVLGALFALVVNR